MMPVPLQTALSFFIKLIGVGVMQDKMIRIVVAVVCTTMLLAVMSALGPLIALE